MLFLWSTIFAHTFCAFIKRTSVVTKRLKVAYRYLATYRSLVITHRRRKVKNIGGPRFRILGGPRGGGPNSQQAHGIVLTSVRRNDVASTSFRRHVPTRFLINQCQIITFLILKSDIIENSRTELKGIVLPVPSNQIKVTYLPFNLVHL